MSLLNEIGSEAYNELEKSAMYDESKWQYLISEIQKDISDHKLNDYLYGCYILMSKDGKDVILDENIKNKIKDLLYENGYEFCIFRVSKNELDNK